MTIARATPGAHRESSVAERRAAYQRLIRRMAQLERAARLRKTKPLFSALSTHAFYGLVVSQLINNKPAVMYANRMFCRMTGYSAAELKTVDNDDFVRFCDLKRQYLRCRTRIAGNPRFLRYETCLVRKDKSIIPVEVTRIRTKWNGHPANITTFFDLSTVKKSEASKREHESRYKALAESSPDMIFLVDRGGRVLYVNPRAAAYLRRSNQQLIGRHLKDLFPPDAAAQYLRSIRSVFRTGKPFFDPPQRLPHSKLWIETRLIPIQAADGRIESVMGISRDVTQQHHVKEALKDNTEMFQLLTTNSFDGVNICTFDPLTLHRRLVYGNDRYVKISGYSRKALKQARDLNVLTTMHAEKSELKRYYRCILKETPFSGVTSWKRPDGRANACEWTAIPYKKDGRLYIMGIDHDIIKRQQAEDALRKSEQKFSKAFMASPNMIVVSTLRDGRIIDVNITAQRLSGYTCRELIGRRIADLKIWRNVADRRRLLQALRRTATVHDMEFPFQTKSGAPIWVSISAAIIDIGNERCMLSIMRDITAQRQVEEALSFSGKKYRMIAELTFDVIVELNLDGRYLFVSSGIKAVLGFRPEDMVGRHFSEFIHPDEVAPASLKIAALVSGHRVINEYLARHRNGGWRWLESHSYLYTTPAGEQRIVIVSRDITERKRTEQSLRESKAMLTKAQQIAHIGSWELDEATHELRWSDETFRIFGYAPLAVSPTIKLFLQSIHPEDRPFMQESMAAGWGSNKPWSEDHRIILPDGKERVVHEQAELMCNSDGHPKKWMGTVQDITERKQADEAKQKTIGILNETGKLAKVGGWEFDVTTGIQRWTDETYRILEIDLTEDEPLLPEGVNFHTPACRSRIKLALQHAVEYGESFDLELEITTKKGNHRWVHTTGKANQENGKTISISGAIQDITKRKHLEMEQKKLPSLILEAQEKERHEISATLHDHLGQLLSLTKMEASSIRMPDDELQRRQREVVTHLDEALASVRNIARTLRPPMLDDLGLRVAIATLVEDVAGGYQFRVLFEQQGPDPVLSKPHQVCLYRVLQEALNNAVRHSKGKLIWVTLRTNATHVTIQVKDNGKGFNAEDNSTSKGIGIKGMRERMSHYGGHLKVQSRPHQGTVLTAVLPLSAPAQGVSS